MSETTAPTEPLDPSTEAPLNPSDFLMQLIVALLAPMFLGIAAGDINLARMAAIETVSAYRTRNHADLIAVAQIIAYGLAALGSLSLSMADDISLSMTLRLRGNANALNRSAEQNRRALRETRTEKSTQYQDALAETTFTNADYQSDDTEAFLSQQAADLLAAEAAARLQEPRKTTGHAVPPVPAAPGVSEKRNQQMWAIAMVNEASTINAGIHMLPPAERKAASFRIAALNSTANQLLTGVGPLPARPVIPKRS
jgi:hypothetical protein